MGRIRFQVSNTELREFFGSLSSGERAQCKSELIEFFAQLTENSVSSLLKQYSRNSTLPVS